MMESLQRVFSLVQTLLKSAQLLPDFSSAQGVFCAVAWFATLLAGLMMAISFIADWGGGDADVSGGDSGDGGDAGWFSVRSVTGFLLGFGWGGFIAIRHDNSVLTSIAIGVALGLVMFIIVAALMRFIYSLKSDGSLDYHSLVGLSGTVYVTIPPHGEPGGQVQVLHPSQMLTMPAIQLGDQPLKSQIRIIVTEANTFQLTVRAASAQDFTNTHPQS